MEKMAHNRGFTLIELSIVLVIIGLIVGGVLVGRDLIYAATMRAQITQYEQLIAAVNTYRVKYNQLPGDDPNATTFGLGTAGTGDGIVQLYHGSNIYEGINAFQHLGAARLVAGTYTPSNCLAGVGYPAMKLDAYYDSQSSAAGIALLTADKTGFNTGNGNRQYLGDGALWFVVLSGRNAWTPQCFGSYAGISAADLNNLDTKVDDGIPFTGKVRLTGFDGVNDDNSMQSMCNDSAVGNFGRRCAGPNNVCATGAIGSAGTYANTGLWNGSTGSSCSFAYRLQ